MLRLILIYIFAKFEGMLELKKVKYKINILTNTLIPPVSGIVRFSR